VGKKINPKKICQGKITQSFPGKITQIKKNRREEVPILVDCKNDLIPFPCPMSATR